MSNAEGLDPSALRTLPQVFVRLGTTRPSDRVSSPKGSTQSQVSRVHSNFNTYPDFSTVTLPSRNPSESRRLSLIRVNPHHHVPNSIEASNVSDSGAHGDDVVEPLPQCCWYRNVVRIATIGDGSCFFHAVLKAGSPEYQKNNSYNVRTKHAFLLRRDLAYLLTLPNPRYPTEEAARRMLWKAYNLDSDESLIRYLINVQMMSFPDPPRMPTRSRIESPESAREWSLYESKRWEWQEHNYPLARKYAKDHDILDCRNFLGDATQLLPLNSYYFTLREGKLPELAIMRKNQSSDIDGPQGPSPAQPEKSRVFVEQPLGSSRDAGWSQDFPDLYQLVSILINPSRYVGDTDVVGWFAEVANVDLFFCHVYNDRIVPSRIVKAENATVGIVINNSGSGDEYGQESTHFETMGVIISTESEYIQTVFPLDHPFLQAFKDQMQSGLRGCSRSTSLADINEQMGGEFRNLLSNQVWGALQSPKGRSSGGLQTPPFLEVTPAIINIPVPHLPDARTLPTSPKSVATTYMGSPYLIGSPKSLAGPAGAPSFGGTTVALGEKDMSNRGLSTSWIAPRDGVYVDRPMGRVSSVSSNTTFSEGAPRSPPSRNERRLGTAGGVSDLQVESVVARGGPSNSQSAGLQRGGSRKPPMINMPRRP
jgi:hypothetical protein